METLDENEFLAEFGQEHPNFLFHGTTETSAKSLIHGLAEAPRKDQADSLLKTFGLSYAELEADDSWWYYVSYNFGDHRVSNISTATKFELAKSYAMRAPEWRYYLLGFVHEKVGDPETHWLDLVGDYLDKQPDPVVLVIETKEPREIGAPDLSAPWRLDRGSEIVLPKPLPPGHRIRYLVSLQRASGYY